MAAPLIGPDIASAAIAGSRRPARASDTAVKPGVAVSRAAATTAGLRAVAAAAVVIAYRGGRAPPSCTNGNRQALRNSALSLSLSRIHPVIDGEASTYHIGLHGGTLLGELLSFVVPIGVVLPVVDSSCAGVPMAGAIGHELRFGPMAAPAEACEVRIISIDLAKLVRQMMSPISALCSPTLGPSP